METVPKFIEEALEEYNFGKLTPKKLRDMLATFEEAFERVHKTNCDNLGRAFIKLSSMFREQKGRMVLEKVDFEWSEEKVLNPFYGSLD